MTKRISTVLIGIMLLISMIAAPQTGLAQDAAPVASPIQPIAVSAPVPSSDAASVKPVSLNDLPPQGVAPPAVVVAAEVAPVVSAAAVVQPVPVPVPTVQPIIEIAPIVAATVVPAAAAVPAPVAAAAHIVVASVTAPTPVPTVAAVPTPSPAVPSVAAVQVPVAVVTPTPSPAIVATPAPAGVGNSQLLLEQHKQQLRAQQDRERLAEVEKEMLAHIDKNHLVPHGLPHQMPPFIHNGHGHLTDPRLTLIEHGGHTHTLADAEQHGALIFGVMLVTVFAAQLALIGWKKYHQSSFDQATLLALWLLPIGYSVWHGIFAYWKMICLWSLFTVVCGLVMKAAFRKPVPRTTPRRVYSFFYIVYRISYGTAITGYVIMMAHFMGLGQMFPSLLPSPPFALLLCFYGLYFGVLGRDLASVCSSSLAINLGYSAHKGEMPSKSLPRNTCAICDLELIKSFRPTEGKSAEPDEKVFVLNCQHQFHENCLRGWTMIGKKSTCPNCSEKVVLSSTKKQPWETTSIAWGWLLDALRYLIVFNPLVLMLAQGMLYLVY